MDIQKYIAELTGKTKKASEELSVLKTAKKNELLQKIGLKIAQKRDEIKEENAKDMEAGAKKGLSAALLDRLLLNDKRIDGMIESLASVIKLSDPVGEGYDQQVLPNGLMIGKRRIPLGVIGMIYESRPNVTIEASSLAIKSGNAIILRGGSEAIHSNRVLGKMIREALAECGVNPDIVGIVDVTDREAVNYLLKAVGFVDVMIARGGEELIRFVTQNSQIPVIKHDKGVCSLFMNYDAQKQMAIDIAINAKTQRPGVCNAIENIYFHKDFAYKKEVLEALSQKGVEIRIYGDAASLHPNAVRFEDLKELGVEYLDLILSVKVVDSMDEAIQLIKKYGSEHSDAILTENYSDALEFLNRVNSSAVYVNASTRFTDGFEMGLGAEIGISTNKLHARGPMGLKELTTYKYVIMGEGQIRQ